MGTCMEVVKVKKLDPNAKMPTKATEGSACYDVYCLEETAVVSRGPEKVRTGLAFEVPKGYFLDIRPRSGMAAKGWTINNAPGTLDSDYRGELFIILFNQMDYARWIKPGDRIAQIRLVKNEELEFQEVDELSKTERGEGGFGSTGR